jgi:hypothetical protein
MVKIKEIIEENDSINTLAARVIIKYRKENKQILFPLILDAINQFYFRKLIINKMILERSIHK